MTPWPRIEPQSMTSRTQFEGYSSSCQSSSKGPCQVLRTAHGSHSGYNSASNARAIVVTWLVYHAHPVRIFLQIGYSCTSSCHAPTIIPCTSSRTRACTFCMSCGCSHHSSRSSMSILDIPWCSRISSLPSQNHLRTS